MRKESVVTSLLIHAAAILLLVALAIHTVPGTLPERPLLLTNRKLLTYKPTVEAAGGGSHALTPASAGHLPPRAARPFVLTPITFTPKLTMPVGLDLPPDLAAPKLGLPGGTGTLASLGSGGPIGIGEGQGRKAGSGSADTIYRPGSGGVTIPVPIHRVEPEYSEEARKARATGTVLVSVEIGADGRPRNIEVLRSLGLGLDERAVGAVSQWLFRPGTKDGRAVTVKAQIEVSFHLL